MNLHEFVNDLVFETFNYSNREIISNGPIPAKDRLRISTAYF